MSISFCLRTLCGFVRTPVIVIKKTSFPDTLDTTRDGTGTSRQVELAWSWFLRNGSERGGLSGRSR